MLWTKHTFAPLAGLMRSIPGFGGKLASATLTSLDARSRRPRGFPITAARRAAKPKIFYNWYTAEAMLRASAFIGAFKVLLPFRAYGSSQGVNLASALELASRMRASGRSPGGLGR